MKLTVAANVQEARMQIEKQLSETMSLNESLNQSQSRSSVLNSSMIKKEDQNFWGGMGDTERNEYKKISHEMGVGSNNVRSVA